MPAIILLVLWTMTAFLWLLAMLGAVPGNYSPWLGWFCNLFLGLEVFLGGFAGWKKPSA